MYPLHPISKAAANQPIMSLYGIALADWPRHFRDAQCKDDTGRAWLLLLHTRQKKMDACSFTSFALDPNVPTGLFDEAINLAKSKSGPASIGFGGEERLEDLRQNLLVHAATGIAHGHTNARTRQ
ncbi:hypothetical protein NKI10_29995 [Mesorhizobium sp. M0802]